ncbi:MAG: C40 family peptidase [Gemmatimonadota bacterium]
MPPHRLIRAALTQGCILTFGLCGAFSSAQAQRPDSQELPKPFAELSRTILAGRDSLVGTAKAQIGTKYRYGASKPGKAFDCSALVQWIASLFNAKLPRTAAEQAKTGIEVPKDTAQLLPGDLLFFGKGKRVTHIGIYVGEGKFVHAANRRKGVIESDIGRTRQTWWKGVRRIFVDPDSLFPPPPPLPSMSPSS